MPGCPERPRDRRRSPREAPADRRHPRQTIPSRLVPVGFGAEARTLFILSGPLFLFQMLNFMVYVVSTVFCGHLGTVELAAVTLSVAFVNVCGVSIGFGLSSACDTLMSQPARGGQARGGRNPCVLELRQPQQEARGRHPAAGRAGAAALLSALLGALPQHPAHPAVMQAGPGRVQAGPGVCAGLHPRPAGKFSLQPAGQVLAESGHRLATSLQWHRGQLRQRPGQLCPGFCAGPGGQGLRIRQHRLPVHAGCLPPVLHRTEEAASGDMGRPAQRARPICPSGHLRGGHRRLHDPHGAQHRGLCPSGDSPGSRRHRASQAISHLRHPLHSGNLAGCGRPIEPPEKQAGPHLHQRRCLYAGVLRGTGRQAFGAVVNAVMYYAIGLPLGVVLTFLVGMGIMGLWLGMLVCVMLATAAFVTYTVRMDWKRAAEEAQKHAGLPPLGSSGSMALGPRPGPEKAVVSSVATGSSPGVILTTYSRLGGHLDLLRTPEAIQTLPAPANRLSAKQLAVRRGAALGVAVGSLIVGLVLRVLTARP
nr:multidrug and toxin extrusion protein 2 isoform X6 [Odocoileus virginianus texanus]